MSEETPTKAPVDAPEEKRAAHADLDEVLAAIERMSTVPGAEMPSTLEEEAGDDEGARARFEAPLPAFVARLMRMSHQPNGRQSSGCATLTAWMRPGGRVSFDVENRPNPIRMPSRVSAIVYRSDFENLRT